MGSAKAFITLVITFPFMLLVLVLLAIPAFILGGATGVTKLWYSSDLITLILNTIVPENWNNW